MQKLMQFRSRVLWRLALLALLLPLPGCRTLMTETRYLDTSCEVFSPITYSSKSDSQETVLQVQKFNREYNSLCRK